jgi:O-antigen ligase
MSLLQREFQIPRNGWIAFAALMLALGWLQPNHYPPWPAFHSEAWTAFWFVTVGLVISSKFGGITQWPLLAVVFFAIAVIGMVQHMAGQVVHFGVALVHCTVALAASLAMVISVRMADEDDSLLRTLFLAVGILAMANVGLALYQYVGMYFTDGLTGVDLWIMYIPPELRPAGNIGQPNQFTTLLMIALVGGFWANSKGKLSWPILVAYGGFLSLGLALAHSRIGLLQCLTLCVVMIWFRWRLVISTKTLLAVFAVSSIYFSLFAALPDISNALQAEYSGRDLQEITADSNRVKIYQDAILALQARPWFGYGFAHLGEMQWELVDKSTYWHAYISRSHNFALDILLWFGMPVGILILSIVAWLLFKLWRSIQTESHAWIYLALLVFILHASVEFPHQYLQTLLPVAVLYGTLARQLKCDVSIRLPSLLTPALLAGMMILLIWISRDYLKFEETTRKERLADKGIITKDSFSIPDSVPLAYLTDAFRMGQITPRPGMPAADLVWMEKTLHGELSYSNQYRYAVALALNDKKDEARLWMRRLNSVAPRPVHTEMRRVWRNYQAWYPSQVGGMEWEALPSETLGVDRTPKP